MKKEHAAWPFLPLDYLGKITVLMLFKNWQDQKNKSLWNQVMSVYEHKAWHSNYASKENKKEKWILDILISNFAFTCKDISPFL